MKEKENFLLKLSYADMFSELPLEDSGRLINGIFNYVKTGESGLTGSLKAIFLLIKIDIDKNEEAYQKRCEMNKINGSKGGAPKGNNNAKKQKQPKTTENNQMVKKTTENNMNNHIHNHNHISSINNHIQEKDNRVIGEEEKTIDVIKEIVDYLNEKTNSKYRYQSKVTQDKIKARLNEKFSIDDFKIVIDKKSKEWLGTEWEKYLCPETLFGNKFEKYLNQNVFDNTKPKSKNAEQWELLKGVYDGRIKVD